MTALPSCVTLKISAGRLRALNLPEKPARCTPTTSRVMGQSDKDVMNGQDGGNLANSDSEVDGTATANIDHGPEPKSEPKSEPERSPDGSLPPPDPHTLASTNGNHPSLGKGHRRAKVNLKVKSNTKTVTAATTGTSAGSSKRHTPAHHRPRRGTSILKPDSASSTSARRQIRGATAAAGRGRSPSRTVTLLSEPDVLHISSSPSATSNEENETPSDSDDVKISRSPSVSDKMSDTPEKQALPPPQRPSLKLKLSKPVIPQVGGNQPAQTPIPTSATRTPSIKLKFGGTPVPASQKVPNKEEDTVTVTPASSAKKRKRAHNTNDTEDEIARPAPKPPVIRKITLKTDPSSQKQTSKSAQAPTLKIRSKGKIPKRPLGVGYDSELEEREQDPVIHEGFILRMQPGPDCDYLRKAIEDGTVGLPRAKGGPDVRMRMLDTSGRRGIMIIRGNQYATTLVDLPCILEGMKSWDKKGWIKSIDVGQMLLVLGRCNTDEEARNYPLPEDVDPKNYQYAHGITAPMKWVRKRRFARTKRARVDDIEAIERRVNALLEADKAAISTRYQLLDHDPRLDEERYSSGLDGEDEDAEGEDDDDVQGYFDLSNGQHGAILEPPVFAETPVEDIGQDEVDEFERMFAGDDDGPTTESASQARNTLHIPELGDSSVVVTSTSASPSVTVAHTPASAAEASSDEDEEDDGGDEDEDLDDAEAEGDENLQQVKDRIQDLQQKIAEQTEVLKQTQNAILKKKLARKIQDLKDDVAMMKKNAGLGGDEDDD
ncbi:hypothetical protein A1O3_09029 [Capronia epimyces CBS 606.96]|uniref:TAFII55 protein conserved region domain-containing protein n=1 Tax=Capronia epimyces CBS 606.96 TaxID=1182542 RepID=W9XKN5_9EURO|nr:uncharacterized protein A1O3_09029 [Capronia epimyces CBS 606.96]EXJ77870.1 hypothetical protein A1O3_09029 [Capronia epimyces CBS 606.96]